MGVVDIHIETERLVLRPPRIEDFDRFAELLADAEACRFIGGHLPRAAAWRKFLQQPGAWLVQGFGMFSMIDRRSGLWLVRSEEQPECRAGAVVRLSVLPPPAGR